jgi:hypothetical protein
MTALYHFTYPNRLDLDDNARVCLTDAARAGLQF